MPYTPKVVDCNVKADPTKLAGKVAIVTGGANGLGEAYVRALHAAKVKVAFGDMNAEAGRKLEAELAGSKFVHCDVTVWDDQVHLFEEAARLTPSGKVHYVVANAGISVKDEVFTFEGPDQTPKKPDLKTLDVNLHGAMYTMKLAFHYFVKQNGAEPSEQQEDTCLILIGSGAAYLDCPRAPQYQASKFGLRGAMRSLRRTTHFYGSRVNMISPWYVRTNILPKDAWDNVEASGVQLALPEDGGQLLLRILSDSTINGRQIFLAPRKWASTGCMDLEIDDFPSDSLLAEIQAEQIKSSPPEVGLFNVGRW